MMDGEEIVMKEGELNPLETMKKYNRSCEDTQDHFRTSAGDLRRCRRSECARTA
jgi:hypothetical protein